jgi:hypothetical protein
MQLNFRNTTNLLLLFFALSAWYFIVTVINPELHYFIQQSAFLTDPLFFQSFVRYPGGIADYISAFVAQFFYFKVFGSFLIVLAASLLGMIAIKLIQRIAGKIKLNFGVFALFILLSILVQCNYYYPFYASIRLLIASVFTWIFSVLILRFPNIRLFISFLMAILLFYLAGGAALFVFAVSIILIQVRFSNSWVEFLVLPVFAAFVALIPWVSYKFIFLVDHNLVYSITHSRKPMIISYVPDYVLYTLYATLPLLILIAVIYIKLSKRFENKPIQSIESNTEKLHGKTKDLKLKNNQEKIQTSKTDTLKVRFFQTSVFILSIQFIIILLLAIVSLSFTIDTEKRNQVLVSFYGANGDWANVIKTAESLNEYDLYVNVEYNKALANTGKLAENLFNYNQLAGSAGLFLDGAVTSDVPFICSDQYYDLGFIHESQHWTFEAQTIFPNSPRLMKRLAQINLIDRNYQLAEVFLRRLDKNMLYHDWVAKYQKYVDDTTLVAKDQEFAWKRKCEPLGNFTASSYVEKLNKLLEANPANKMAYDYLVCTSLLDGDLGTFATKINDNTVFSRYPLPRSWDEAMVLYYYMSKKIPSANDIKCTRQRRDQFSSFIKAIKPFGNNWRLASKSLKKDFGETYWYYLKCLSPNVTKAQLKKQKFDE